MLGSHRGFANTLHSEPHEEASIREALGVCSNIDRERGMGVLPLSLYMSDTLPLIHNTVSETSWLKPEHWEQTFLYRSYDNG